MKINDLAWKTSRRIKENGPDLLTEFSRPPTASRVLSISKMTEKEIKRIDYQFVALPTELVFALDPYCLKTIAVMIDRESYWKSRNKVFNGYFTLSVEELAECLCLENWKDARLTLEALYRAGLIDVKAEAGKRLGAKVKLNWEEMKKPRFETMEKLPRNESITYCTESMSTTGGTAVSTTYGTTDDTYCTATLEQEQEIDVEKEIEIEQEIEPTAIGTSISFSFEDYLKLFIERYPYINYSYSPETFNNSYYQELTDLQTTFLNETGLVFPTDVLAFHLQYYKTTGKVYDFT